MKTYPPWRALTLVVLLLFASLVDASAKTVRVLAIGNSFSDNATRYLDKIATAAGDTLVIERKQFGSATLEQHWAKVTRFEADPTAKEGRYADGRSLKEALLAQPWDLVTIQQYSRKSHDPKTYEPWARQLHDYIKRHAPQAQVVLHQTWEYRADDPQFHGHAKPGDPTTPDAMYAGLTQAYAACAQALGIKVIPVGDAFHLAAQDPAFGFRPLAQQPAPDIKELPAQPHALHVGWHWGKRPDGSRTLGYDGHHANLAGEYLGGCVWYEFIFGRDVRENTFVPRDLDPEFARFLRGIAHRAVEGVKTNGFGPRRP
ncbi:DUF4886 domain-containing protein [Opitutus sp. ER46]|uniref:DUF4886 domain-containing protein n=1 Tax=Opitutus sp. ER46 TaxID=2161864 RepID=UPI000D2F885D|nr:DUF4886 domain-containing protein [Opitutus sp. ER46]PTX98397.1 DUF4886 domain-containing protein [Opitutus sp. ER46]